MSIDATEFGEKNAKVSYNGHNSETLINLTKLRLLNDPSTYPAGTSSEDAPVTTTNRSMEAATTADKVESEIPKLETVTNIQTQSEGKVNCVHSIMICKTGHLLWWIYIKYDYRQITYFIVIGLIWFGHLLEGISLDIFH